MKIRSFVFAELGELAIAIRDLDGDDLLCASERPFEIVDHAAAADAFFALGAPIALAARVGDAVTVPTPYGAVGPALMGRVDALRALPNTSAEGLQRAFLAGANLELDVRAELFLVRDGTGTDALRLGDRVMATETGTEPAIVVGNLDDLDDAPAITDIDIVAPDILRTSFWSPRMCAAVVRASEAAGMWGSDDDDPVPGSEVSLAALSPRLFAHVDGMLETSVVPQWRRVWPEVGWFGLHDAFVIKYEHGTTADALRLHHDVAQVSGSIRCNDNYEGGALEFPRQDWNNCTVPVGELVSWPSLVTHPHRSAPVSRGTKYGLTIWTRLPG